VPATGTWLPLHVSQRPKQKPLGRGRVGDLAEVLEEFVEGVLAFFLGRPTVSAVSLGGL
jgi:hypothetical protein